MKKVLLILCLALMISVGCTQEDAEDVWTKNIYPATNNTYDIGSTTLQYQDGYFTNIWASNNVIALYFKGNGSLLTGINNVSGFVPYSGSIQDVDLGTYNLTVGSITAYKLTLSLPEIEDIHIVPGSFDRPGISDPDYVAYSPNGGTITTYLTEWAENDIGSFTVQIPHSYAIGMNISVHAHWTAGADGVLESGNAVGWKVDYTWANIDSAFGNMSTANLSDECDGTNHKHQMTPEVVINGSGKTISSMLMCNIKRTDTGADDTWSGTTSGHLPMLLEVDLHFEVNTLGSSTPTVK